MGLLRRRDRRVSRRVVGGSIGDRITAEIAVNALEMAR